MTDDLPDFDRFGHDDAWRIGSALVAHCRAQDMPIVVSITLGEQSVFHVALPGATADNDRWVARKANVVRRFDRSSLEVWEHYAIAEDPGWYEAFDAPRAEFAPGEGAVPVRVRGAQVGVLAISGLEHGGDHELALRGLRGEL